MIRNCLLLQLLVVGTVTTVVLENLSPLTQYSVSVFSVVGEQNSEPLTGTETTCKCVTSSVSLTCFLVSEVFCS